MPTFKIKDLMINLGGDTEVDFNHLIYECQTATWACGFTQTEIRQLTITPVILPALLLNQLQTPMKQDIVTLRTQLKRQIELLDQQEKDQEAQLKPQTLEEVEQLEHKMKEALAEIHKMKEEFKKK